MAGRRRAGSGPKIPQPPNYITPGGFKRHVDELVRLRTVDRPKVCQEVSDAAAQGDRSENAEYIYGKRKLREIDRRMGFLERRIDAAVVVDPNEKRGDRVLFGATVVLEDESDGEERSLQLVGEDETDAAHGRISWRSPIGAAVLGKREGDEVSVQTPAGIRRFTIVELRYGAAPVVAVVPISNLAAVEPVAKIVETPAATVRAAVKAARKPAVTVKAAPKPAKPTRKVSGKK